MKRVIWYIVILASVLAAPVKPMNVGELIPVRVVSVQEENGWVVIKTDTGNKGLGGTPKQALRNLKDTACGEIYLDTAEFLLLGEGGGDAAEELRGELRRRVRVCETANAVDLSQAAKFLSVHGSLPKLKDWKSGSELPVLSTFGESLIFLKKVEKSS